MLTIVYDENAVADPEVDGDDGGVDGGLIWWLWVMRLAKRPIASKDQRPGVVVGHYSSYGADGDARLIRLTSDGFHFDSENVAHSFAEIDETWDAYSVAFVDDPKV